MFLFYTPKNIKNQRLCNVFRRYWNEKLAWNWLQYFTTFKGITYKAVTHWILKTANVLKGSGSRYQFSTKTYSDNLIFYGNNLNYVLILLVKIWTRNIPITRPLVNCSSKCCSTFPLVFLASIFLWAWFDRALFRGSSSPSAWKS